MGVRGICAGLEYMKTAGNNRPGSYAATTQRLSTKLPAAPQDSLHGGGGT
jgi:hypothetical protein